MFQVDFFAAVRYAEKEMPQCGFSSRVAGVLNFMGVEFKDINVLADDSVRQGIKDYSDWPTIPQLYVKGEFVGGCDIVQEMVGSGELYEALGLEPGNGISWVQEVPLVSLTPDPDMGAVIQGRGTANRLQHALDFVAVTERVVEEIALDRSELVFVGYGIVAPEFGWNDYCRPLGEDDFECAPVEAARRPARNQFK